jgi:hypothetical protein
MSADLSDDQVQQIMAAVFAGEKIRAIRIYRAATNTSLVDAKNFVEALEARLRLQSPEKFTTPPTQGSCGRTLAILVAIGLAIYLIIRYLR